MKAQHSKESLLNQISPNKGGFPWLRAAFFLIVLFAVIVPFTSVPEKMKEYAKELILAKREVERSQVVEAQEEEPDIHVVEEKKPVVEVKTPKVEPKVDPVLLDRPYVAKRHEVGTKGDMVRMSKGFNFKYSFETSEGALASVERKDKQSYVAEYKLNVKLPEPSKSLVNLQKVNPNLGKMLPGLSTLLDKSRVSDFYFQLYENKVKRLKRDVLKLNKLFTKHNFYDCETILNLTHEPSGQRMLLLQGDMDVVSDGSDGDRLATMPAKIVNSTHYQPFTSYGWKKTGTTPNPMMLGWQKRIQNAKAELAKSSTKADRKQWLRNRLKMLKRGVSDMKARSYLIAEYDPFIVMPVNMITNSRDKHAAKVGDYAVVIYGDKMYPSIVGDGGPTFKVGEASLRLAQEINKRSSSYSRPVSDLTVTYLVFSRSRDVPASAPDYKKWHAKCSALLEKIGGVGEGYSLHQWEDLLAPKVEEEGADAPASETEDVPSGAPAASDE